MRRITLLLFILAVICPEASAGFITNAIWNFFSGTKSSVPESVAILAYKNLNYKPGDAFPKISVDKPLINGQFVHLRGVLNYNHVDFCVNFQGRNASLNSVSICSTSTSETNQPISPKFTFESRFSNGTVLRDRATNGMGAGTRFDFRVRILPSHIQVFANRGEIGIFDKPDTMSTVTAITVSGNFSEIQVFTFGLTGAMYLMPARLPAVFNVGDRIDVVAQPIAIVKDLSSYKKLLGDDVKQVSTNITISTNSTTASPLQTTTNGTNTKPTDLFHIDESFQAMANSAVADLGTNATAAAEKMIKLGEVLLEQEKNRTKRKTSRGSRTHSSFSGHTSGGSHTSGSSGSHSSWHGFGSGSSGYHPQTSNPTHGHFGSSGSSWHSSGSSGSSWSSGYHPQTSNPSSGHFGGWSHPSSPSLPSGPIYFHGSNDRGHSAARWASGHGATIGGAGAGFAGGYTAGYLADSYVPSYSYRYNGNTYYSSSCYDCGYHSCYSCHSYGYRSRYRSSPTRVQQQANVPQSNRIDISLLKPDGTFGFTISIRYSENRFVMNSFQDGIWEKEISRDIPFPNWKICDLTIQNYQEGLGIYINGKKIAFFDHRDATRDLDKILIDRDVEVFGIYRNGELVTV